MNWLDRAESGLVEIASKIGPIMAPVPTAYLVGRSTIEHLSWPWPVGVVAAIVVECLGLASTGLALDLYSYNKSKRKSDPSAPFKLSVALVLIYFFVALAFRRSCTLDRLTAVSLYDDVILAVLQKGEV